MNSYLFIDISMKKRLEDVTLIWADHNGERLKKAFEICEYYFDFADKKLFTSSLSESITDAWIKIIHKELVSIEDYSYFMIKELNKYVDTKYVLIIQHDGFILNPLAWSEKFLDYDYIWAPWRYNDDNNVGNWWFSLRSKKLLETLANDSHISEFHPEDHHICRTYGDYLKAKWIKFAPEDIAKNFSIEWSLKPPALPVKFWSLRTSEFWFHWLQKTDLSNRNDWNEFFDKPYDLNDFLVTKK